MNTLQTYGATVFKFDRSGKKWKELGSGVVSFTLKDDRLLISVNALTFFVQGGVRQKGPKAVVMRVRDDSSTKGENIILAVRFERERDARNLFTLLASTQWIRPRTRGRKPPRRRPPPAFFMSMGTREQENIRALVSNAELRYIEDHTIQRQLKAIYKMTPSQIEEAINFFQPWLRHSKASGNKKSSHYHAPSLSLGTRTDSSLPSIRTSKLVKGRIPPNYTTPAGSTRPAGSLRAHAPSNIAPGVVTLGPVEVEAEGKQDKPEHTGEQLHLESNEVKERPTPRVRKSSTSRKEEIPLDKNLSPPEGNLKRGKPKGVKRVDNGEADERTSSLKLCEPTPTPPTSSPGRSSTANRVVSPLTTQNLMLHNKMVPQLKRDTHEKVTLWLKEFEKE